MRIDKDKIVRAFEDNPVAFMSAGGALLYGMSKIIAAVGNARGSAAYARQVNYRIRNKR